MTKQQAVTIGDLAWKILIPIISAISLFLLNSIADEMRDLRSEIRSIHREIQEISIDQASLKARVEFHEKVTQ